MRTLFVILVLVGSIAHADKDSAKGRVDDCFIDLSAISKEKSDAYYNDQDRMPALNAKWNAKQQRCISLKKDFVKQYGAYKLPKGL